MPQPFKHTAYDTDNQTLSDRHPPRRFGKSLLTSTIHAYFEGRKDLFEGLAIEKLETEWVSYPVLHFDMSLGKHLDKDALSRYLHYLLQENEKRLGVVPSQATDVNIRLTELISNVYIQTGRQVVVLIDEYDAPLLDVMHEEENLPALRAGIAQRDAQFL